MSFDADGLLWINWPLAILLFALLVAIILYLNEVR